MEDVNFTFFKMEDKVTVENQESDNKLIRDNGKIFRKNSNVYKLPALKQKLREN